MVIIKDTNGSIAGLVFSLWCLQAGRESLIITLRRSWEGLRGPTSHSWWQFIWEHYGPMQSSGWIMYMWDSGYSLPAEHSLKFQWRHREKPVRLQKTSMTKAARLSKHVVPALCWLHSSVTLLLWLCVNYQTEHTLTRASDLARSLAWWQPGTACSLPQKIPECSLGISMDQGEKIWM